MIQNLFLSSPPKQGSYDVPLMFLEQLCMQARHYIFTFLYQLLPWFQGDGWMKI